jgi:hypothetical protein
VKRLPHSGESLFKEDSPVHAPKTLQKISPDACQGDPASDTGAQAHESYSLGVGLRVRRRRTAIRGANRRASSSPLKAADQSLARGPGPRDILLGRRSLSVKKANCHTRSELPRLFIFAESSGPASGTGARGPRVILLGRRSLSAKKAKPPREERTVVPLLLRQKQRTSLWHGGPGPRVILLGHRFLGVEKSNYRSRQYHASSGPPQKIEKVNFQNQCSGTEAPRAWPGETIKCGGHRSVNRGDRRGS